MDQIQIDIVESKFIKRNLKCFLCVLIPCILNPEFCGNKKLLTGDTAFFDCRPDRFLVSVCCNLLYKSSLENFLKKNQKAS